VQQNGEIMEEALHASGRMLWAVPKIVPNDRQDMLDCTHSSQRAPPFCPSLDAQLGQN
jgi:hypothetical protein